MGAGLFAASGFAANNGIVSGRVAIDDGGFAGGARIILYDLSGAPLDTTYTDNAGAFSIEVIAGAYFVSAEKDNLIKEYFPGEFMLKEADRVVVYSSQKTDICFLLDYGGWITGTFSFPARLVDKALVTAIKVDQPEAGWHKSMTLDPPFPRDYALYGLLPGIYKVVGRARGLSTAYYPGVTDMDQAAAIEVVRNSAATDISFSLETVGWGDVQGRAFNQATGQGIAGISMFAYQWRDFWEDPSLTTTQTGENGMFSMSLPAGQYCVFAVYYDILNGGGNIALYYNRCYDPFGADIVTVGPDLERADINFPIDYSQAHDLSISGSLLSQQTGSGLNDVIVTALDASTGQAIGSACTANDGEFAINDLCSGSYLLMFSGTSIIPYFYSQTESWQDAEVILLQGHFGGVRTEAITQDYGNMGLAISGRVTSSQGPVSGARIYAFPTSANHPITYARSDDSGDYSMVSGLVPGSYSVACDMFGFDGATYPSTIYLDLMNSPDAQEINFALEPVLMGLADAAPEATKIDLSRNYPNPFNSRTVIQLWSRSDSQLNLTLAIYDILGQVVGEKALCINPGPNAIEVTSDDFAHPLGSGVYFYRINGASKTNRMLLLK
jgi:hypothetical protein